MVFIKWSPKSDIIRRQPGGREIFENVQADIFLTSYGSDEVGMLFYRVAAKLYHVQLLLYILQFYRKAETLHYKLDESQCLNSQNELENDTSIDVDYFI